MNDSASEGVKKALELGGDAERIKDYYRDWAADYDADVGAENYRAPQITASLARLVHLAFCEGPRRRLKVMDAGCGTGLSGVALREAGFAAIDGFDIAPEMVDAARETGAYEALFAEIDLNADEAGLPDAKDGYDIVTSVGVFTLGHVAPSGLDHLIAMAKPGGFLIISTRDGYLEESGFRDHVSSLEADGSVSLVNRLADANYVGDDRADYWVYRKAA